MYVDPVSVPELVLTRRAGADRRRSVEVPLAARVRARGRALDAARVRARRRARDVGAERRALDGRGARRDGRGRGGDRACTRRPRQREVAAQLADSGASIVVTLPALVEAARAAGARDVIAIGPDLLAAEPGAEPPAPDPASARAAAVLERHDRPAEGRHAQPPQRRRRGRARSSGARAHRARRRARAVAPFFHVMGFVVTLRRAARGRRDRRHAAALRPRGRAGGDRAPPRHRAGRPAAGHGRARAPPAVDRHDLRSLELIVSGGAPLGAGAPARGRRPLPARRGRAGLRADRDGGRRSAGRTGSRAPCPARSGADGRDRGPDRG